MAALQLNRLQSAASTSSARTLVPALPSKSCSQRPAFQASPACPTQQRSQRGAFASVRGSRVAAKATYHGSVAATPDMKFAIVVARFNSLITKGLLEGAQEAFVSHGVPAENIDVAWVPGSFEVPVLAKSLAKSGKYAGVVCIGAVIRGATTHYDAVVSAVTSGVLSASMDTGVPVIFGVLTTDNLEQALDRTGGKVGNKGAEAAITALETASILHKLKAEGKASW